MIKREYIYGFFQFLITFIIGWFMECVSSNKILVFEGIFSDAFNKEILKHSLIIFIVLGAANLLLFILSHRSKEHHESRKFFDNICNSVFDEFIKRNNQLDNSLFRVSLFKVKKGLIFKKENYYCPQWTTYLRNIGRAQTRQKRDLCKIKFLPDEGTVGSCYSISKLVFAKIIKFEELTKENYYNDHLDKTALPVFKAKRLQHKSSGFLGCPVKFYNSDVLFGVLVVDCDDPDMLETTPEFRIMEEVLSRYSVFFNEKN